MDGGGFGKVFPVTLGHLGLHHLRLQPRGIEDAAIIGAPCDFERIGISGRIGRDTG